jgi:glycine cleavage system H lipoate-binding protein
MGIIETLSKTLNVIDEDGVARGWIVKYNSQDRIKEVKLLYNPNEYDGSRTILNDEELLIKLKQERCRD